MKTKLAATTLIEVMVLLTVSFAQQSNPIADPETERILDKAAQAEGSDKVLGMLRTLRLTGAMYWSPNSRQLGDIESIIKFPDKFRDSFMSAGRRSLRFGFDGTEAWKQSTGE